MPYPLGSEQRPLVLRVTSEQRLREVTAKCEEHGFTFIIGLEPPEDLTDLKKAILQKMTPEDVYAPCPCGSGKKFKFCCAKKPSEISI
jgi:hypothetical protein